MISADPRPIAITVNGDEVTVEVEPRTLLIDTLRAQLGLCGAHVGCEQGVCGACTVIVDGEPIRACLMLTVQAEGSTVQTVESLAGAQLHALQQVFHEEHGLQCGFCTPGILMTMLPWIAAQESPSEAEIREALSGNLCRCTGYVNIVRAVQKALEAK